MHIGDMHDQRIETRPVLGGEYFRDSGWVGGVRAQAIDGFGWKGDKSAIGQQRSRVPQVGGVCPQFFSCGLRHVS